jgi:DNA-binding NarL/FixJ family response regulator
MAAAGSPRILIVDDHDVVRHGVRGALTDEGYAVVGDAATGAGALDLARRVRPDIAVVDLRLPDMRGDELCRRLLAAHPGLVVVLLTTYFSEETVTESFRAGAAAYVTKAAGLPELLEMLEKIREPGARPIEAQMRALAAGQERHVRLTPRQEIVLELAARGLTSGQIGEELSLAESTVRFHIQKLKRTFGVRSKTELIVQAIKTGAIAPAPEATE